MEQEDQEKKIIRIKKSHLYIGFALVMVLFLLILFYKPAKIEQGLTNHTELAQCLTEKGAVFYGTSWCGHCKDQKEMFGDAMQYITFVDCDDDKDICTEAGVSAYPTWIINDEHHLGTQQIVDLKKVSGC